MTVLQAVFLGIFQGLTEFLPVSSSGHLVIGQKLLGISQPDVLYNIFVHIGTLLAIVAFFNKKMAAFYKKIHNLKLVFIGTLPIAVVGYFLNDSLELIFNSLLLVAFCLLFTAGLLLSTKWIKKSFKAIAQLKSKGSFVIGLWQAFALLPGISRSGATITAGLWQGLQRKEAFSFSFYLGAPAMMGALFLQIPDLLKNHYQITPALVGFLVAGISGFLALKVLEKVVLKAGLTYFAFYCLLLSSILLTISFISS